MGLLSALAIRGGSKDMESTITEESSTDEEYSEEDTLSSISLVSDEGSAESNPPPKKTIIKKAKRPKEGKQLWQHNLSARSNQDIQRAYEENLLKEMTLMLNKRTFNDTASRSIRASARNSIPIGGIWMKLEAEWRESLNQRDLHLKSKNSMLVKSNKPRSRY